MLARVLDGPGQAEHFRAGRAVQRPHVDELHAALRHGTRLVEDDRADPARLLEHFWPLDEDAELRARPVPTMSAVGVASPRAQGHAMMSTATAAEKASPASPVSASQPASVASEMPMTAGTNMAETRSASRWIGALPDWASVTRRAIWARAVSAPTLVARTISRPYVLMVAPATSARPDVHRHRLARQHRLVDADAPSSTTPSVAIFSGPDDEPVADAYLVDQDEHFLAVPEHARLLRAELEQRAQAAPARLLARSSR